MHAAEWHRDGFTISTDRERLDLDVVAGLLATTYWAAGRSRETIARSLEHSVCFGLYEGDRQVGFARVVSDQATFAWLCDVVVEEGFQGRGLGKWLVSVVMSHPDLRGLRRWILATQDAHKLYEAYGWRTLSSPERWMEKYSPDAGEVRKDVP